jgi:hypothetical protein
MVMPGAHPGTKMEHKVVYYGRPDQCLRCKAIGHLVKNCTQVKR